MRSVWALAHPAVYGRMLRDQATARAEQPDAEEPVRPRPQLRLLEEW